MLLAKYDQYRKSASVGSWSSPSASAGSRLSQWTATDSGILNFVISNTVMPQIKCLSAWMSSDHGFRLTIHLLDAYIQHHDWDGSASAACL